MTVGTNAWTATRFESGNTEFIKPMQDDRSLTFRQTFDLLRHSDEFARWYTRLLKDSRHAAYFWEHPPLNRSNIDAAAEFVLVGAPGLENLRPDATPFRQYFKADEIAVFENLGGDALLIAPAPDDASADWGHLAAFLRTAPESRVRSLWRKVAETVASALIDEPLWLSTSGHGVAWLHVRLDSSPKYYQHRPYRHWPRVGRRIADESVS